jgi:hypothetical protein
MKEGEGVVRPVEGVLVKELDGEGVLLDLGSERYFGLNRTAFRMWRALTESPSIDAALDELALEYDVEAPALERDARALLETLLRHGLVRVGHA